MKTIKKMDYIKMALDNVLYYDDLEGFLNQWGQPFIEELTTSELFEYYKENGEVQSITLGTYNGSINKTDYRNINDAHILDAIYQALIEEFETVKDFIYSVCESDPDGWENWEDARLIYEYSEAYNIAVVDDQIYKHL